ncbi:hypothetical protein ACH50O_17895 [Methylomonas sp. 2BW1-5-20]|uniref:hypothetical protein n=1 Tax=Methylomonas sp. 2BW1-5-20 TaxID=3376686 RepID=UPI0040501D43
MNQTLLQRVLDGDQTAQTQFGEAEHCVVIDWRDGPAEVVEAIAAFLPTGYLALGTLSEQTCELIVQGRPPVLVEISPNAMQEKLLLCISNAIAPEYEIRQYRPMDGDGYSVFVAPQSVWANIESAHPKAVQRLFLSAQRLAAYWSKGYLARVFSKP